MTLSLCSFRVLSDLGLFLDFCKGLGNHDCDHCYPVAIHAAAAANIFSAVDTSVASLVVLWASLSNSMARTGRLASILLSTTLL